MIKLGTLKDLDKYTCTLSEVKESIAETLTILDENYGAERSIDADLGGYVLIIETQADINELHASAKLDLTEDIYEYVENVGEYLKVLYLLSSDFAVVVYIRRDIATAEILAGL